MSAQSPSPPPQPPIPLTPGPRAALFSSLFSNALSHTLRTCSYANFSACFPTPARYAPEILNSVWTQITQGVEERAKREFEDIMAERDVVASLNELERLVGEAKARRERGGGEWMEAPHTLPPERLYLAHLAPYLAETEKSLQAELKQTQSENEALVQRIHGQEEEVESMITGLEKVVRDLEGSNMVMDEVVQGTNMAQETSHLEDDIRAARGGAKL